MRNNLIGFLQKNEKKIGFIASTMAIVMFISLLEIFVSNYQNKSRIFLQPTATALNGFFWCFYALARKDWFLLVPNILALFLGFVTALFAFI